MNEDKIVDTLMSLVANVRAVELVCSALIAELAASNTDPSETKARILGNLQRTIEAAAKTVLESSSKSAEPLLESIERISNMSDKIFHPGTIT